MTRVAAAVSLLLLQCGPSWTGDPEAGGLALEVKLPQNNARWVGRGDLVPRIRAVVELSSRHWGMAPDAVSGWRLVLTEGLLRCGPCESANGCTTDDDRTMTISTNFVVCVESSALAHEIGHVALGDSRHLDRRWQDTAWLRMLWERVHFGQPPAPDCGQEPCSGQWQGR